jgi:hypothetical protein
MRPSPRGAALVGFIPRGMSANWLCSATQQRSSNWLRSAPPWRRLSACRLDTRVESGARSATKRREESRRGSLRGCATEESSDSVKQHWAQNWLRSATTLPWTRPPLRPRIGFVPQLRFRAPGGGSGSGLASFRNYASVDPATTPAQDWLRSATTLPCTPRRFRPRIGFVPQLRFRGPGACSRPGLASFRNFASVHPAAAPAQNWLRSAITLPSTRRRLGPGLASFRNYASADPALSSRRSVTPCARS